MLPRISITWMLAACGGDAASDKGGQGDERHNGRRRQAATSRGGGSYGFSSWVVHTASKRG